MTLTERIALILVAGIALNAWLKAHMIAESLSGHGIPLYPREIAI